MKCLIINKIVFDIACEDKSEYGAIVKFKKGMNIVYGPNSVGKSSIMTGIVYALGGEKSLGIFSKKQNPFKPEFYKEIDEKKIKSSTIYLEINNCKDTITIKREIKHNTTYVSIFNGKFINYSSDETKNYIVDGEGVFSENGFQNFIFKFLNITKKVVPKHIGNPIPIYFENLFPMFFVEQRAGWSEIQARQITRYGTKDIKKIVFEYIMGLQKFDLHALEIKRDEMRQNLRSKEDIYSAKLSDILIEVNGVLGESGDLIIQSHEFGDLNINNLLIMLKDKHQSLKSELDKVNDKKDMADKTELTFNDKIRVVNFEKRKISEKILFLKREIRSYNSYIERINVNRYKNKQLKKINEAIEDINISACPICEMSLDNHIDRHCHLCKNEIKRISTPEENISFLEDEEKSFKKILIDKNMELQQTKKLYEKLVLDEKDLTQKLNHQLENYYGPELLTRRTKIEDLDQYYREIIRIKNIHKRWKELVNTRKKLDTLDDEIKALVIQIKDIKNKVDDKEILENILQNFKSNIKKLNLFEKENHIINSLKLDETDNYCPYLKEYDLRNIISSSDNIRLILGYYLALLQTSVMKSIEQIRFFNLLLLDEPNQQNLDKKTLQKFIELTTDLNKHSKNWQVIITTYNQDRSKVEPFLVFEFKNNEKKDYLLKQKTT